MLACWFIIRTAIRFESGPLTLSFGSKRSSTTAAYSRASWWRTLAAVTGILVAGSAVSQEGLRIVAGSIVYIEYRVELVDGTLVTSNVGKGPIVYEAGGNKILPALDKALRGRTAGESGMIRLSAREAFGTIDESLFVEVPLDRVPTGARTPGAAMVAENPQGEKQRVEVRKIIGQVAILDYNHPLAGEELIYFVNVLDVK